MKATFSHWGGINLPKTKINILLRAEHPDRLFQVHIISIQQQNY